MSDCLFCKIIKGEIPSTCVYDDDGVYAFNDIDPKAPVHFLVVPKQHIEGPGNVTGDNSAVVSRIFEVISKLAKKLGLNNGFRVVANCGEQGGQTVNHLHFHVLSGRDMSWPPG